MKTKLLFIFALFFLIIDNSFAQNFEGINSPFLNSTNYISPLPLKTGTKGIISVYPYRQNGQSWSSNQLGTCSGLTIGTDGCAITCVAMLLKTNGVSVDPGQLNTWLTNNSGYSSGCLINWNIATNYPGSTITWSGSFSPFDLPTVKNEIDAGNPMILKTTYSTNDHFVVIKGYSGSGTNTSDFLVIDPLITGDQSLSNYTLNGMKIYHNVTAAQQPDFIIYSVSGPTSAYPGQTVNVTIQTRNQGDDPSQSGTYVLLRMILSPDQMINLADTYYSDYQMPITDFAGGVVIGHSYSFTIPSSLATGTYYWGGYVDASTYWTESDENNNALCGNAVAIQIVGIEEIARNIILQIFPNPATNNLTIETPQKSDIEILNIQGQLMKSIVSDENHSAIDISGFSSGMYFVKVKTTEGIIVKKFIKK